jgi:hypothetical protein
MCDMIFPQRRRVGAPNGRARSPSVPSMEVIFCCFSERDKSVYENLTRTAGVIDVSRNTERKRKYL